MSEPRLEDDAAFYDECEICNKFINVCECEPDDPDRLHDERGEL